jgi:hypothetical protein
MKAKTYQQDPGMVKVEDVCLNFKELPDLENKMNKSTGRTFQRCYTKFIK